MKKMIPVKLDCEHTRWFSYAVPDAGEDIWCPQCAKYRKAGPAEARYAESIQDDFRSVPEGQNRFTGECLYQSEKNGEKCGHTETHVVGWHQLKEKMHRHYMRTHTRFGATITVTFTEATKPPPGQLQSSKIPPF